MKYLYIITIIAFTGISLNLSAQKFDGGVYISKMSVTPLENIVLLEMVINIRDNAVPKGQSITIAPTLSDGSFSASFPYVLINGKNKRQTFERQSKFRNTELVKNPPYKVVNIDRKYRSEIVNYSAEIAREHWMDSAIMGMEMILSSGAGERQYYAMEASDRALPVPAIVIEIPEAAERPKPPVVYVPKERDEIKVAGALGTTKTERQIEGCAHLDFEPSSSEIVRSYKRNSKELAKMDDQIAKVKSNPNAEITAFSIVGFASPEGRYSENERVANERVHSFARYVQSKYGISPRLCMLNVVAEDWDGLRKMVVESNIHCKNSILSIIDSDIAPDAKESQLRRLDGGSVWKIMIAEMFPESRRVEYRIEYKTDK